MANESSNNQQQKETLKCIVQRQEKAEQVKYNDKSVEVKRAKRSNCKENERGNCYGNNKQQDIKCEKHMKCDKCVETGVQCGYCERFFHFNCERKTKEKVM